MKRCSEMILSGYKGGIYEAITFLSVFFVWLWSEYIHWFCALYLIWEKKTKKKKHLFIMLDLEGNSLALHGR